MYLLLEWLKFKRIRELSHYLKLPKPSFTPHWWVWAKWVMVWAKILFAKSPLCARHWGECWTHTEDRYSQFLLSRGAQERDTPGITYYSAQNDVCSTEIRLLAQQETGGWFLKGMLEGRLFRDRLGLRVEREDGEKTQTAPKAGSGEGTQNVLWFPPFSHLGWPDSISLLMHSLTRFSLRRPSRLGSFAVLNFKIKKSHSSLWLPVPTSFSVTICKFP